MAKVITRAIHYEDSLPNYFRADQVAPRVNEAGEIEMYYGRGAHRSWGNSRIHSRLIFVDDDLVVIEAIGWHKFTKSPVGGMYYFVVGRDGRWKRTTAHHRRVQQWQLDRMRQAA